MICGVCNKPVGRQYYPDDTVGAICPGCWVRLPGCARCGVKLLAGEIDGDRRFCGECFAVAPPCALCGHRVGNRHWTVNDLGAVCQPCWEVARKCEACKKPTLHPVPVLDGSGRARQVCAACERDGERCAACHAHLAGQFFVSDRWPDRKLCHHCTHRREQCDFCALPVLEGFHHHPDGRISCAACRATAVRSAAELAALDRFGRQWIAERLGWDIRPAQAVPVHLSGGDVIAGVLRRAWRPTQGFDARERGVFVARTTRYFQGSRETRRDEAFEIHIEEGLPRAEAHGLVVHELVHLWQYDAFPRERVIPRLWEEGIACWAQYHALLAAGFHAEAEHVATSRDPIYGGGFREVLALEQAHGFDAVPALVLARVGGRPRGG